MAFNVPVNTDLSAARRDVAALGQEIVEALNLGVVDLGTSNAVEALEELIALAEEASEATNVEGNVDVDAADALAALEEVIGEIENVSDTEAEVTAVADVDDALAELAEIASEAEALDGFEAIVGVTVEGADQATSALGGLDNAAEGAASKLGTALPGGIGAAVAALGAINPAIAITVAALGAIELAGIAVRDAANEIEIATGATGAALDGLTQSALNVSEVVPSALGEIASIVGTVNTFLGATDEPLEALTEGLADVSRLLGEDAAANAVEFSKALNLFGIAAEEGTDVIDLLFVATKRYGLGFSELTTILQNQGGLFQAAGFDLEASVNLIGQFNLAGLRANEVNSALIRLIANAEDTGESYNEMLQRLQASIVNAATEQEAFAIGIEAFGTRGGVSFSQALRTGLIDLTNLTGALGDTRGAVAETARSTETEGQAIREALNGIVAEFGPAAEILADGLLEIVQVVGQLPPELIAFGAAAGAAFLAFGPAGAAVVGFVGAAQLLDRLFETDLDRSLESVEEATIAYTDALQSSLPVNEATEIAIGRLIDRYNELNDAIPEPEDVEGLAATELAVFYSELDEQAKEALDSLIEIAGGTEAFVDAILQGDAALGFGLGPSLAKFADQVGQTSDEYELAIGAVKGLTAAQLRDVEITEETARARFDQIAGLDAYETRVRELGRAYAAAGETLTPFTDAQNQVNRSLSIAKVASDEALQAIRDLGTDLPRIAQEFEDAVGREVDQATIDSVIFEMEARFNEEAILAQAETVAGLAAGVVESTFGNPFAPKIDTEDINEYLAAVAELQLEVAKFQLNLIRLEGELPPDEFAALLEVFSGVGDETAATFAAKFASAIGTEDFDEIRVALQRAVDGADLLEQLTTQLGDAQVGLPVEVELDDEQIRLLGETVYGIDVTADLDDAEIQAALEADYGIEINAALNIDESTKTIPIDFTFSQADLDLLTRLQTGGIFAEGAVLDRDGRILMMREGGVIADGPRMFSFQGQRFIAGEDPRGPENVEVGPDGLAVVGPYHEAHMTIARLERTGTYQKIEPILRQRFEAERLMMGAGGSGFAEGLRDMGAELAAAIRQLDGDTIIQVTEAVPRTADPTTHYHLLGRAIRRARGL